MIDACPGARVAAGIWAPCFGTRLALGVVGTLGVAFVTKAYFGKKHGALKPDRKACMIDLNFGFSLGDTRTRVTEQFCMQCTSLHIPRQPKPGAVSEPSCFWMLPRTCEDPCTP